MTEAIELPDDIGRNDPCPCGSGKKYKKCHMRMQRAQKEASKSTASVEDLIGPDTNPWQVFTLLSEINADNKFALFWELIHDEAPLREEFDSKDAYLLDATQGSFSLPAGADYEFVRMRIDEPDVHVMLAKGLDDPRMANVRYELITLRRNGFGANDQERAADHHGWRLWAIEELHKSKNELEETKLTFADFGFEWKPRELRDPPTRQPQPEGADAEEE